jgi:glycosyltransferase involved in cell wall biosynthesis
MMPQITAIIPTYKRPHWLKRSVLSVQRQTYPEFVILIADNASGEETDVLTEALMREDPRIKLLRQKTNIGPTANFQSALMQVKTPYVCFLPDDDFFAPFFFEETIPFFDKYPEIAFCGGGGVKIDEHYRVSSIVPNHPFMPSGYYAPPEGLFAYLNSSFAICFPPLLFKTEILKAFGGIDLKVRNGIDEHLISQCSARHPIYVIPDRPYYFGFQHAGSLSRQIDYSLFSREAEQLHGNLKTIDFAAQEKEIIDQLFLKRKQKIFSTAYHHFCQCKDFKQAQFYAQKMFALSPSSRWKRKIRHASFCHYLPFVDDLYNRSKAFEIRLRNKIEKKPPPAAANFHHPDAAFLEDYARNLAKNS